MTTPHIAANSGEFAKTVLMPGDPLRAKLIAETFLDDAKCVTSVRNVLGYTGTYKGKPVSVMASGMGIPSISIYATELFTHYGVEEIIRIGSCGSIHDDIKLGLGGLVDIEFITQYGVLLKAPSEPSLLEWSDNVRLLEALSEKGCFGELDFQPLIDAYRTLRSARHRKSLADGSYQVSLADFPELRTCVRKLWDQVFA